MVCLVRDFLTANVAMQIHHVSLGAVVDQMHHPPSSRHVDIAAHAMVPISATAVISKASPNSHDHNPSSK